MIYRCHGYFTLRGVHRWYTGEVYEYVRIYEYRVVQQYMYFLWVYTRFVIFGIYDTVT